MIKQVIGEHTIDISLLPEKGGHILDLGCRGFTFRSAFPQHYVTSVDCDDLGDEESYLKCAVSNINGRVGLKRYHDKQATQVIAGDEVDAFTLHTISRLADVQFWDVIKMDIEGSELPVIMDMDRPMATQISIEFHLHTGQYGQYAMRMMENRLAQLGYKTIQHTMESRHGLTLNYWDSLFVL